MRSMGMCLRCIFSRMLGQALDASADLLDRGIKIVLLVFFYNMFKLDQSAP